MHFIFSIITSIFLMVFVTKGAYAFGGYFFFGSCLISIIFAVHFIYKSKRKILSSIFVFAGLFFLWGNTFLMILFSQMYEKELCLETSACEIGTEKKQCGLCGEVDDCVMSKEICENLYHAAWYEGDFYVRSKPFCRIQDAYTHQENCLKAGGDWVNKGVFGDIYYECDYTAYCAKMGRKPHKWY